MTFVRFKRSSVWALSFIFLFSQFGFLSISFSQDAPAVRGDEISVVILPQADGTNDDVAADTAAALRQALPLLTPVHVISPQIVEKVLSYYQGEEDHSGLENASDMLSRAKEHYFQFHYDEALAETSKTIEMLKKGSVSENGGLLQDALVTQGVVARSAGKTDLARSSFEEAVRLNPLYQIDYRAFPPSIVGIFQEVKQSVLQGGKGSLRVETNPYAAEVFINGVMQGISPLEIPNLPVGAYAVLIKTNKYERAEKSVNIETGKKVVVNERLRWVGDKKPVLKKISEDVRDEITSGVRSAELLKADKAIIVDSDADGVITARMLDRKYRASHRQIVVKYAAKDEVQAIADLTQALVDLLHTDILNDPMKYLDAQGIGDPILLSGRKKKIYKQPLFWAAVGTAAAGAVAGGVAAALSGGSSKPTGNLAVQFK